MKIMKIFLYIGVLVLSLLVIQVMVVVFVDEVVKFGISLILLGVEKVGNVDGSIFVWDGGLVINVGSVDSCGFFVNFYVSE